MIASYKRANAVNSDHLDPLVTYTQLSIRTAFTSLPAEFPHELEESIKGKPTDFRHPEASLQKAHMKHLLLYGVKK